MFDPTALGVYVVTSGAFGPGRGHRELTRAAIAGGATAVQLRAPELDDGTLLPLAAELAAACRDEDVMFIVNDRLVVAMESGAAGVHLGQDDDLLDARRRLGVDRVLGMSVSDVAEATAAERAGADYVGVTVWSTSTKPEARGVGLEGLADVAARTDLPVVGIGGISVSNCDAVLEAGAVGVAVISGVAAATDPVEATRAFVETTARFRAARGTVDR